MQRVTEVLQRGRNLAASSSVASQSLGDIFEGNAQIAPHLDLDLLHLVKLFGSRHDADVGRSEDESRMRLQGFLHSLYINLFTDFLQYLTWINPKCVVIDGV